MNRFRFQKTIFVNLSYPILGFTSFRFAPPETFDWYISGIIMLDWFIAIRRR